MTTPVDPASETARILVLGAGELSMPVLRALTRHATARVPIDLIAAATATPRCETVNGSGRGAAYLSVNEMPGSKGAWQGSDDMPDRPHQLKAGVS